MAVPFARTSFSAGELAPSLFGHTDFSKFSIGAATMRNCFVNYRGGAYGRQGTHFVGFSKQTTASYPPRVIGFQFSSQQGLMLEFGNQYMRVIKNGAFVVDRVLNITAATKADPCNVTASATGATGATADSSAVTATYAPGDFVTLDGGTYSQAAVLKVDTTKLLSTTVLSGGSGGYVPADTIVPSGGTQTSAAELTVATTQVVTATINAAGSGGTNGNQTLTGTTGTGTKFTALVTISGGAATAVLSILTGGSYTVNPTSLAAEPVTGASLTGCTLTITMGVETVTVSDAGTFTVNPPGGTFTQASTSGSGAGATFQMAIMGPKSVSVSTIGAYSSTPSNPVSQASTSGRGEGATFTITWGSVSLFSNGDWIEIAGVGGMTELNGGTFVVANTSGSSFDLLDVYGNNIDSSSYGTYTSGGSASRIYTLDTPYVDEDLRWLKVVQSADEMTIGCWNQETGTAYQTYDLTRSADNDWTIAIPSFVASIDPPTGLSIAISAGGSTRYKYVITAVSSDDASESIASDVLSITGVDITSTAGTVTVGWGSVTGASQYNIYRTALGYGVNIPSGSQFGYIGFSTGTSFVDSNITPDFTQSPPTHDNPFSADTPSVASYFQTRRFYAGSPQHPNTYWASQPGSFFDFDKRIPTLDTDALSGSPWSLQVNAIQFLVPMPGGLVVFTGKSAWQLNGTGSSGTNAQAITPSSQNAVQQTFNGCSAYLPPISIDFEILYAQPNNSTVYDFSYNFWANIYTGADITVLSSHLFFTHTILEWAWAEWPYKLVWAVRSDGTLLSLTFLKAQEIAGWARHDTQGAFVSVASCLELPVSAVYVATRRTTPSSENTYMIERLDDYLWETVEDAWCVDAGLSLDKEAPAATLTASSATGLGACSGVTGLVGGSGYSASTYAVVVDDNGNGDGSGANPTLVIADGVITSITFGVGDKGTGYSFPALVIVDPAATGSGASADIVLDNTVTLTASASVFSVGDVGSIVRVGLGIIEITAYSSGTSVTGNVLSPIVDTVPNTNGDLVSFASGDWTMSAPVSTLSGLQHLAGLTVTGLADGNVISPRTVSSTGTVTLDEAASSITIGLGFTVQLQTTYIDLGAQGPTVQGQRKRSAAATIRVESSSGLQIGSNQIDGSTLSPPQIEVDWINLVDLQNKAKMPYNGLAQPLYTGDARAPIRGGFSTYGQVAVQQTNPLPMRILSIIPELDAGDLPQPPGRGGGEK